MTTDGTYSFGDWARRRRKALDLTQDEVAARVGCSKVLISKIETDARRPSREMAALLAAALEIEPAERPQFVQAARAELAVDGLPRAGLTPAPPAPAPAHALRRPFLRRPPAPAAAPPHEPQPAPQPAPAADPLWAWWMLASATGWGVGRLLGWYAGSAVYQDGSVDLQGGVALFGAGVALTVDTITLGLCVAAFQAAVLRRRLRQPLGWLSATALAWVLAGVFGRVLPALAGGLLLGIATGAAQWLALRRSRETAWWVAASAAATAPVWLVSGALNAWLYGAIGGTLADVIYQRGPGWAIAVVLVSAAVGAAWGALTAWPLRSLLAEAR